jgi:uncharacterized SAM-binding protein YcdF (DUF218 family)
MFLLRWATAPIRWFLKIVVLIVVVLVVYFGVTLVQVWLTSRHYAPVPAQAIVVMGAAQYNGVPSPDLQARLNEALILWQNKYAPLIVCTGYKQPGDHFTEAESGQMYLESKGVPAKDILVAGTVNSTDTWGNVVGAVQTLKTYSLQHKVEAITTVLIVTDPFHEDLSMAMASNLGLKPHPTPTRTSPITGTSTVPYFLKETVAVGVGRIIGFSHIHALSGHF